MSESYQAEKLLLRYSQAVEELHQLEEEFEEKKNAMLHPSAVKWDDVKTGMPYCDNSQVEKKLIRLQELQEKIDRKKANVEVQKAITEAAIKAICWRTETRASIVLQMFYVDLMPEAQIARILYNDKCKNPENHRGLLRKVRRDRERGIRMLQRVLPTEEHFHAGAGVLPDMALFGDWWRESEKERIDTGAAVERNTSDSEAVWRKLDRKTYRDSLYVRKRNRG